MDSKQHNTATHARAWTTHAAGDTIGGKAAANVTDGPGGIKLLPVTAFKVGKKGKTLTLMRPDGAVESTTGAVPM